MYTTQFIINPIAGTRSKSDLPSLIEDHLDPDLHDYSIVFTEKAGHGTELAIEASKENYDLVVAVGGDGTINEVAQGLLNTSSALGIIPMGSGNGLARHLEIPLNTARAIDHLNAGTISPIDTGEVNGKLFLCTAGVGFDAHISRVFSEQKTRGFYTYLRSCMREFGKYVSKNYKVSGTKNDTTWNAFTLTIANANQYGNNAKISPDSIIDDGWLELCVVRPFPSIALPKMMGDVFRGKMGNNKFHHCERFKTATIDLPEGEWSHVDGEPMNLGSQLTVKVNANNLRVLH